MIAHHVVFSGKSKGGFKFLGYTEDVGNGNIYFDSAVALMAT